MLLTVILEDAVVNEDVDMDEMETSGLKARKKCMFSLNIFRIPSF